MKTINNEGLIINKMEYHIWSKYLNIFKAILNNNSLDIKDIETFIYLLSSADVIFASDKEKEKYKNDQQILLDAMYVVSQNKNNRKSK